jgi:hypothetical protein
MIKYIIHSKKWRDKKNGNTYHSVRIINNENHEGIVAPFRYGYGSQFLQSASDVMIKKGWIKEKLKGTDFLNIHVIDQDDCKKRDVKEWGKQ